MGKLLNIIGLGVGSLAIVYGGITASYMIEDETDPLDDTLSPLSRVVYNLKKNRAEDNAAYHKELEDLVKSGRGNEVDKLVIANFKLRGLNETLAKIDLADAEMKARMEAARSAPPITFRPRSIPEKAIEPEPADMLSKINKMESTFEITEDESGSLKAAWNEAEKSGNPKNAFQQAARKILSANKDIGRDSASVNELTLKMVR